MDTKTEEIKDGGMSADARKTVLRNQLDRNYQFFGDDAMQKLQNGFVVVLGVGGVGSHCVMSLARSGVGKLRLVDFDTVTLSSLNRHSVALRRDVGASKVGCLRDNIAEINPDCQVDDRDCLFEGSASERLLKDGCPDYVIDCMDNMTSKVDAIRFCFDNNIPIVSACGAGGKDDPTKLRLADVSETIEDDLARALRMRLASVGISNGLTVCYSQQVKCLSLAPMTDQSAGSDVNRPRDDFRVRTVPVFSPVPAMMGQILAAFTIRKLSGFSLDVKESKRESEVCDTLHMKTFRRLFESTKQHLHQTRGLRGLRSLELPYGATKAMVCDVYGGQSVLGNTHNNDVVMADKDGCAELDDKDGRAELADKDGCAELADKDGRAELDVSAASSKPRQRLSVKKLQLVPWVFDIEKESNFGEYITPANLVLVDIDEARRHLQQGGTLQKNASLWGQHACDAVDVKLKSAVDVKLKSAVDVKLKSAMDVKLKSAA